MSNQDPNFSFRVKAQPLAFFETPIAYCQLDGGEDFLLELESIVRKRREENEGVKRSNIGGWHSDTKMLQWGGQAATKLGETAISVCKRMSQFKGGTADSFDWKLVLVIVEFGKDKVCRFLINA